ncbi:MAG TPA: response regulator, partial [Gemmatimonadaceae bacterium]|nr:response regulator [Gemmatimonadaceae bacterium]
VAVRSMTRRVLERGGYHVLDAARASEALLLWRSERARIDALVTDVRMPEMGGREILDRLRQDVPGLPAVFVSGYTELPGGAAPEHTAFVEKPFSANALLTAIGEVVRLGAPLVP